MSGKKGSAWRAVFEETARAAGGRKDEVATVGSINWLRTAMERRGANPNVVRNIIYRDKGRLHDKRALFLILEDLRRELGLGQIADAGLRELGSTFAAAELEVDEVLGREQKRVYRAMVGGIRAGSHPRLLVTGRAGSGKTMLADYVQRSLELEEGSRRRVVRVHFRSPDLDAAFVGLSAQLGLPAGLMEARLVRIGSAGPFAVQADAQAEVVRLVLDGLRGEGVPKVVMVHLSKNLSAPGRLGSRPLRLNTPDVPRVDASEWLWRSLLRPLAGLPETSIYVSVAELPAGAHDVAASFEGPLRLTAPTVAEARRFVAAHAGDLPEQEHEAIVARSNRSYEELRTRTLLTLARAQEPGGRDGEGAMRQLASLAETGADQRTRAFLVALTAMAAAEEQELLGAEIAEVTRSLVPGDRRRTLSAFELSFLDRLPGREDRYRTFSRRLLRMVEERLAASDPEILSLAHAKVAALLRESALADPASSDAGRYLNHAILSRSWSDVTEWLETKPTPFPVLLTAWEAALSELEGEGFERVALAFARQMMRLSAFEHVETVRACEMLSRSASPLRRSWTAVLRAQAEVAAGRFERAHVLLQASEEGVSEPVLDAERDLTAAGVLRWRGELQQAAELVGHVARGEPARQAPAGSLAERSLLTTSAVWAGLIAKDGGDLAASLQRLWEQPTEGDLQGARLAFQRGDVALRLGLLDTARRELELALHAAEAHGALPRERARFAARRGTLARMQGDHKAAASWFDDARRMVAEGPGDRLETAFGLARVEDEAAYSALAAGDHEAAIVAVTTAIATFQEYQQRRDVDAGFRIARAEVHLATAYALRGLNVALARPLPLVAPTDDSPDLTHALQSLADVVRSVTDPRRRQPAGESAVRALVREARLTASYVSPDPRRALGLAQEAVAAARYDYQRSDAYAALAVAHLRLGDPSAALEAVRSGAACLERARMVLATVEPDAAESGDLGLQAQHVALKVAACLRAGDHSAAAEALAASLCDQRLSPFHEGLLRAFGEAAEGEADEAWRRHRGLRATLGIGGTGPSTPARLPDALVAAWRARSSEAVSARG